ncbi:hypothetical protein [Natronomonas sp. EA1]|uniref:hypothetical protein n=1 Tax=Natronomonas sp. EA1 TaxID=3421655 RepID=UPI003EBAFDE7
MTDRSDEFGTIYLPALRRIRDLWTDLEPLTVETGYDDPINPTELRVTLDDGIDAADTARIDIQWSTLDNYTFHYTDSAGLNWRFDRHPNTHSPERHFHPPAEDGTREGSNDGTVDPEPSCIQVGEVSLVTRAVHKLWRVAYESGDPTRLNTLSNPP